MLTIRKYEKHIRTLIDEITHTYFYLIKDTDLIKEPNMNDFTYFSSCVRETLDKSEDILDFCANIRNSLDTLRPFTSKKEKILLSKLDDLYEYELYARKELDKG